MVSCSENENEEEEEEKVEPTDVIQEVWILGVSIFPKMGITFLNSGYNLYLLL